MRINRSLLNWGVFLIALGAIPIAVDQGWLETDIASELGQLWPLILVGIGLGLILRWTPFAWFGGALVAATFGVIFGAAAVSLRDNDFTNVQGIIPAIASGACATNDVGEETSTSEGIASGESFDLTVSLPCGELTVMRAPDTIWRVDAVHDTGEAPRVTETEDASGTTGVQVRYDGGDEIAFIGRQSRSQWDVAVPAEALLTVDATLDAAAGTIDTGAGPVARVQATLNAADATIDLAQAETPETMIVGLTLNASDGRLTLPQGLVQAAATLNASSLDVCVPEAAPLQVELEETLSSNDLSEAGLEETSEGIWVSPGFSSAGDHVVLALTSTVSSLSIERPEACA